MECREGIEKSVEDRHVQSIIRIYSTGKHYKKWSNLRIPRLRPQELALIKRYCPDVHAKICNLGCGAGRETFSLYRMGYNRVKGVDCTAALLEIAWRHCKELGLSIQFDLATADNLPYASETFDVVTMFENLYGHITPRAERLRCLGEVRRVLKPGGLILMTVTSIYNYWRYFLFIKTLELLRSLYNPHDMEWGDQKIRRQSRFEKEEFDVVARSHWFLPNEVPDDAREINLSVIQRTTVVDVCADPKANSAKFHKKGRLVYVLQRPR